MFVDYVGRNWGVTGLTPAAQELAEAREPWGLSLLIWRLIDPTYPAGQVFSEPGGTQELLSAALYCDVHPIGPGFIRTVTRFIREGGYSASHAGLALQWVRERGCPLDRLDQLLALTSTTLAAELQQAKLADDLHLEMGAVLAYIGDPQKIPPDFVELASEQQHPDGGWGINGPEDPSNWHPTLFGAWMLLALDSGPGAGATLIGLELGA